MGVAIEEELGWDSICQEGFQKVAPTQEAETITIDKTKGVEFRGRVRGVEEGTRRDTRRDMTIRTVYVTGQEMKKERVGKMIADPDTKEGGVLIDTKEDMMTGIKGGVMTEGVATGAKEDVTME